MLILYSFIVWWAQRYIYRQNNIVAEVIVDNIKEWTIT